jgi:putative oxidoreductase
MKFSLTNAKKSCDDLKKAYQIYVGFSAKYVSNFLLLSIRVYIGWIFLNSGLVKLSNIDNTIILFAYEYDLPYISPEIAAHLSIFAEIVFGSAIIVGFVTKLSALPLIIMAVVIQTLVEQNDQHIYWIFLLGTLAIYGGGLISFDGIASKFLYKKRP